MNEDKIQIIADEITAHVLTVIFGDRYTNLDNVEDDQELNWLWENINEKVFGTIYKSTDKDSFPIASVSRADLEEKGYDTSNVDDATMKRLASKLGDAYVENGFWIDLPIMADYLEIPKKEEEEEEEEEL